MSNVVPANQLGVTHTNQKKSTFFWKIPEFSKLKPRFCRETNRTYAHSIISDPIRGIIQSPKFYEGSDDLKWPLVLMRVNLALNENSDHFNDYLGFQLICYNFSSVIDINIYLTLFNGKTGQKIAKLYKFGSMIPSQCFIILSAPNDNWIMSITDYDEVHVLCEYAYCDPKKDATSVWSISRDKMNQFTVESLKKQWENQKFCDFELIAPCGRKLHAHGCILAAKSPIFNAMLTNEMNEKRNQSVKIDDISYEALQVMLSFFYTGQIDKLDHKLANDLLEAAEKYQVKDLKDGCQYFLTNILDVDNVMKTLKISKTFGLKELEEKAKNFARSNAKKILLNRYFENSDDFELIEDVSQLIE